MISINTWLSITIITNPTPAIELSIMVKPDRHMTQSSSRPRFFRLSTKLWPALCPAIPILLEADALLTFGWFIWSDAFADVVRVDWVASVTLTARVACVTWVAWVTLAALDAFVGLAWGVIAWVAWTDWVVRPDVDGFSSAALVLDAYSVDDVINSKKKMF